MGRYPCGSKNGDRITGQIELLEGGKLIMLTQAWLVRINVRLQISRHLETDNPFAESKSEGQGRALR